MFFTCQAKSFSYSYRILYFFGFLESYYHLSELVYYLFLEESQSLS